MDRWKKKMEKLGGGGLKEEQKIGKLKKKRRWLSDKGTNKWRLEGN